MTSPLANGVKNSTAGSSKFDESNKSRSTEGLVGSYILQGLNPVSSPPSVSITAANVYQTDPVQSPSAPYKPSSTDNLLAQISTGSSSIAVAALNISNNEGNSTTTGPSTPWQECHDSKVSWSEAWTAAYKPYNYTVTTVTTYSVEDVTVLYGTGDVYATSGAFTRAHNFTTTSSDVLSSLYVLLSPSLDYLACGTQSVMPIVSSLPPRYTKRISPAI